MDGIGSMQIDVSKRNFIHLDDTNIEERADVIKLYQLSRTRNCQKISYKLLADAILDLFSGVLCASMQRNRYRIDVTNT